MAACVAAGALQHAIGRTTRQSAGGSVRSPRQPDDRRQLSGPGTLCRDRGPAIAGLTSPQAVSTPDNLLVGGGEEGVGWRGLRVLGAPGAGSADVGADQGLHLEVLKLKRAATSRYEVPERTRSTTCSRVRRNRRCRSMCVSTKPANVIVGSPRPPRRDSIAPERNQSPSVLAGNPR